MAIIPVRSLPAVQCQRIGAPLLSSTSVKNCFVASIALGSWIYWRYRLASHVSIIPVVIAWRRVFQSSLSRTKRFGIVRGEMETSVAPGTSTSGFRPASSFVRRSMIFVTPRPAISAASASCRLPERYNIPVLIVYPSLVCHPPISLAFHTFVNSSGFCGSEDGSSNVG